MEKTWIDMLRDEMRRHMDSRIVAFRIQHGPGVVSRIGPVSEAIPTMELHLDNRNHNIRFTAWSKTRVYVSDLCRCNGQPKCHVISAPRDP